MYEYQYTITNFFVDCAAWIVQYWMGIVIDCPMQSRDIIGGEQVFS